ncbi:MAG: hypothetical protein Tsb002_34930 [Wenzhouxiangellaceae bacterium]
MQRLFIIAIASLAFTLAASCKAANDRIKVIIPSVEDETEYIWRTLRDIPFFTEHGYEISLPDTPLISDLIEKSKSSTLTASDRDRLEEVIRNEVYDQQAYQTAVAKIESRKPLINQLINQLDAMEKNWHYQSFETYSIKLTFYGPGGSFDPDEGLILLFATPAGAFKQYTDPTYTIIHEAVHIGIEESIVSPLDIPHSLRERIVDRIIQLSFPQELPEYRVQDMGHEEFDNYFNDQNDIKTLKHIVEQYIKVRGR